MFFVVSKFLDFFLTPLTWIIGFVVLALLARNVKSSRRYLGISLAIVLFFSNGFIGDELLRLWEVPMQSKEKLLPQYDLGIVLGGGMVQIDKKTDKLIFRSNTDRIFQTILLYKEGTIRKILVSGGSGYLFERDVLEATLLKRYLLKLGTHDQDILIDSLSDNTHENAVNSARVIRQHPFNGNYLLITSSLHMRRSMACFKKEGILCTPYPTNVLAGDRNYTFRHLFLPDVSSLIFYYNLLHEIIGIMTYKVLGYA
jgi:uncharacterized SAM-binding protein YcdF (DUF218 family)